jgi:hypothetical protein
MIYDSKEDAIRENSGAMTALEIVTKLKESHGYVMHPTNVGQDAIKLKAEYVEYKPLNQQGRPSKLYLESGIAPITESLIKKAKRRQSFGQSVT